MRVVGCRYLAGRLVNGQRGTCRSVRKFFLKKKKKKISQAQIIRPFIEQDEKKKKRL